ncbi:hypothetical protein AVEN_45782-1 [Araneus ventricosus]|uniref:Peptidase A2 domain-containing protein n=1 Tax=Araneus ventricosus TaxID=182803 RepID=A0A4Y2FHH5_ARAVE|nr:hypothetical protein AVEN_45782-1 [Araneus ventricosus]
MQFSALSEIGTISICREFPIGKFSSEKLSSEKLLINISFSDQIYQNGNRFSDTDLNDMVSKILYQFPMNSMKGNAKKDEFMLLGSELREMKLQISELSKRVERLNACFASLNAKKRHSGSRSESRNRELNNRLCSHHYKFGDRAHKCLKPCSFQNNGVKPSEISVASETLDYSRRLYVRDRITKTQFFVDTGSDVSCYPKSDFNEVLKLQGTTIFSANGSHIKTCGSKLLSFNLRLQRKLQWPFVIADITKPIIGAGFLQQFGLLVDLNRLSAAAFSAHKKPLKRLKSDLFWILLLI